MAPWLAFVEAYLVKTLLQSPSFHRAVRKVHKGVHRMRNGIPPDELGGTNIEKTGPSFVNHFFEEIREQAGRSKRFQDPSQPTQPTQPRSAPSQPQSRSQSQPHSRPQEPRGSDPMRDSQQSERGFVSHFMDEIRQQFRGGDKGR